RLSTIDFESIASTIPPQGQILRPASCRLAASVERFKQASALYCLSHQLVQPRMKRIIASNDLRVANRQRTTTIVGHKPTGLTHKQTACRSIPRTEITLPKAVVTTGGDPCEIERGGTETADTRNLWANRRENTRPFPEVA